MARGYPRFLFSNPQNVKTPGPFLIHCLQPRLIFQVVKNHKNVVRCIPLDKYEDGPIEEIESSLINDAEKWLRMNVANGEITF